MQDRRVGRTLSAVKLTLVASLLLALPGAALAQPAVTTDQREYRLGATVHILGSGFAAGEAVTLKVHRTSIFDEHGPSFDPFVTEADAFGRFSAPWPLVDGIGVNFLVSAEGPISGMATDWIGFHRGAEVATDRRRYRPGDTAHITGAGFRPGDAVSVFMENAQPTAPGPATADAEGRIAATFLVDANPSAPSHRVRASGAVDGPARITAMAGFAEGGVSVVDDGGADDIDHTFPLWRLRDLLYYRFSFRKDITPRVLDLTIGWNATWSQYSRYTVYLDTNHNGRIDRMVSGEVESEPVDSTRLAFSDSCDDTSALVCAGRMDGLGVTLSWFKATAGTLIQNIVLPMSELGLAADGSEPTVVNVCNGSDCLVTPGNGFLTIEQVVPAGNGTATFAFNLAAGSAQNGATAWAIAPALAAGGAVGAVQFISMAPGTYALNDVVPAGWQVTGAGCRTGSQVATATDALPIAGPGTVSVGQIVISPGMVTRCKFTASRLPAITTATQ